MPRGTQHTVRGLLVRKGDWLAIEVDGGGTWRLEAGRSVGALIGHRVVVAGIRDDFDLLAVTSIRADGDSAPPPSCWRRLFG